MVGMGTGFPEVTPTTRPLSQPFSRLNPSHSRSSSFTRDSSSLLLFSIACSRSFFLARNRADAAVFLRRLSSDALRLAALLLGDSSVPSAGGPPGRTDVADGGEPALLLGAVVTEEDAE